jgi:hypothetical protein
VEVAMTTTQGKLFDLEIEVLKIMAMIEDNFYREVTKSNVETDDS